MYKRALHCGMRKTKRPDEEEGGWGETDYQLRRAGAPAGFNQCSANASLKQKSLLLLLLLVSLALSLSLSYSFSVRLVRASA
jgi:hypothetical protein